MYAAATLTLTLSVIFLFKRNRNSGSLCPPVAATIVGMSLNFNRLHDFLLHHHRRYKTYRITCLTYSSVFTTDPANVEHILKSNFANYVKGKPQHDVLEDLFGDGIFTVDGEPWRQQRKVASFEFSNKVLKDFSSVVFRENAVKLSKILLEAYRTKQTVEMQGLLLRSTMDGFCKLGFGVDINSLSNNNSGAEASFAMAFDTANALLMWRFLDVAWKLKRYFNILSEANLKDNIKTVNDFVYKVIQSRKEEISSVQNNYVKPDILSRCIALTEKQPEKYSDKYLRDVIINFLIAGRNTTADTLCWFFHLLCKSPGVEKKILQEIHDLVKVNESATIEESISIFSQSLIHTVLDKMHYLRAALTESLRLYPAVPLVRHVYLSSGI